MGEFATAVQNHMRDAIAEEYPSAKWATEHTIAGTPVDIAGKAGDTLYIIELEWRRADPADNAAKLFRHLYTDGVDAERVVVFHVFTQYYELTRGGVSAKRKNAEFVGSTAAEQIDTFSYITVEYGLEPPKRGEEWPDEWQAVTDEVTTVLCDKIRELSNQ